jgi:hypothetical protein
MDNFEKELAQVSEQGSQLWHDIRVGRFTSSENHRLIKSGYREMTDPELKARPKTGVGSKSKFIEDLSIIAEDTLTYIYEKVAETLTGEPKENVFSHATSWGDTWEPWAAEYYAKIKGVELEVIGFIPFGDHAGGSIDRGIKPIICDSCHGLGHKISEPETESMLNNPCNKCNGAGSIRCGEFLEIKCPYNPKNQIDYLMLTDQYDLKRMYPNHYWQMVSNSLFSKKAIGHFATFDPRMKLEKHKMKEIEVIPPQEDLKLLARKLQLAENEKQKILKLLS